MHALTFVYTIMIARFIWITKLKENIPTFAGFKNYFKFFFMNQKHAGILSCIGTINIDEFWTV